MLYDDLLYKVIDINYVLPKKKITTTEKRKKLEMPCYKSTNNSKKSIYKTTNMKNKQTNRHGNVINQAPWGRGDDGEAPG